MKRSLQNKLFVYVRSKSKTKDKVGPLNDNNGNVATDNGAMCEILNNFFCSVCTEPKRIF